MVNPSPPSLIVCVCVCTLLGTNGKCLRMDIKNILLYYVLCQVSHYATVL